MIATLRRSLQGSGFPSMTPPRSICLLRLSALGDVTHVVPVVREIQRAWPGTQLTWVIGKLEHKLVGAIPGIEFIVFDKRGGWSAVLALRRALAGRRFDVLLHMQLSLRANLLSSLIQAEVRVGYDRERSKEMHSLFINRRIAHRKHQHALDALGSFIEPIGLTPGPARWELPIPDEAHAFARQHLPGDQPAMIVCPCSSERLRNWRPERYAAVADHAAGRHGFRIVLSGGRSALEREMGDAILAAMRTPPLDLIGKDTFPRLLALLQRARVVLAPDTGPMHMANAVGTTVIGLHAATPAWRSGPYSDRRFCVDRYDEAARQFKGRPGSELSWGRRVKYASVMDLITSGEVIDAFERYVADGPGAGGAPPR